MLAVAAMSLTGGIYNVGEPLLALDVLHAGSAGFAAITWAGAAGMLLGTVLSSSARETAQFRTRIMLGVLLCAAGYAGAASAPHLLAAVAALFFVGLGNGLILGPSQMLIQRLVPESLHGRAFGLADALFSAGLVGGLLGAGAVAAASDARVIFALAAGIAAAVAFTLSLALRATDAREPVAAVPVGLEVT
jgi:MFS family permease